ncbi:ribonuclease T2 family protein [Altericroceibacterium endophyticum]|uniref:Ribonuclease T n=1 Tax=Altericroceibacterium endophyticum TaxID=1808508 RepID=A0A6I4T563_9SPHN|nr:ribonuclease T [Altericroceibacterium endophyticum]MXO65579.1 ribonuclease T [Altericroceibacterium endophyticum]
MLRLALFAACACLIALAPISAQAQAYQCRIGQVPTAAPHITPTGPPRNVPATSYVLALSWSPEFCHFRKDDKQHWRQCSGRAGRFGFIVHGLWPQNPRGDPQYCRKPAAPTSHDIAKNLCVIPSVRLLAHEWARHGSCMAKRPATYFKITRILWNSLRWPDFDHLSRRDGLTAGMIRQTFAAANPYWEPDHIGLKLNEKGWLEEMRLCYGLDYMPTHCDSGSFGPPDDKAAKIWRGL